MATETENYNLRKPDALTDSFSLETDFIENWDKIDTQMKTNENENAISNLQIKDSEGTNKVDSLINSNSTADTFNLQETDSMEIIADNTTKKISFNVKTGLNSGIQPYSPLTILGNSGQGITSDVIGSETAIPHGLGTVPNNVLVTAVGEAGIIYLSDSNPPDATNFYVKSDTGLLTFNWLALK